MGKNYQKCLTFTVKITIKQTADISNIKNTANFAQICKQTAEIIFEK